MTASCQRCRFWDGAPATDTVAYCHRFPPQPDVDTRREHPEQSGNFPITLAHWWCGEFRVRVPIATAADPYPFVTDTTLTTNT